ncbi:MAG: YaiO family outer membrane beta-barrel protein [Pseudomonadota bacterium]
MLLRTLVAASIVAIPTLASADDFAAAQAFLRNGNPDEALQILDGLSARHPGNVDYELAAGQALARLGRYDEAHDRLQKAIELAPQYEDVWREQHTVLKRLDNPAELAEFRHRAAEQFPAALWWQPDPDELVGDWTLLVGAGVDDLDNGQPGWNNQFVELQFQESESRQYHFRVAREARNRQADTLAGAGLSISGSRWFGGGTLAVASNPDFQARYAVDAHAGRALADGWVASLSARHREYESAAVSGIAANVERYFADYRVAYSLNQSWLDTGSAFASHVLTGNWYYEESSHLGVSFSSGREAEAIGNGRVFETDVRSIAVSGRHELSTRLSLHWWLGMHDQGDLYRRRFIGLAVSIGI